MASKANMIVFLDEKGEWRWRLLAGGRIIADSGEGYSTKANAKRAAVNLPKRVAGAQLVVHD